MIRLPAHFGIRLVFYSALTAMIFAGLYVVNLLLLPLVLGGLIALRDQIGLNFTVRKIQLCKKCPPYPRARPSHLVLGYNDFYPQGWRDSRTGTCIKCQELGNANCNKRQTEQRLL